MNQPAPLATPSATQHQPLGWGLATVILLTLLVSLCAGPDGWSLTPLSSPPVGEPSILWEIRAPRALGSALTGALFGLAGALAQGLFRNPLADPFLLGSASGASLGVVVVLAAGTLAGSALNLPGWLSELGLVSGAFAGALAGVSLTLLLSRGAEHTARLLLAGVVVGVVLGAVSDLITLMAPDALRGRQAFGLGNTSFFGWTSVTLLALTLALALPLAWKLARVLDALSLGEDSASSLGLNLPRLRTGLVAVLALATGTAVAQAGLIAFVGLVCPHLVRRFAHGAHGFLLLASAGMGAALLMVADLAARTLIAPQELPVGILTAVLGGVYLLWMLRRPTTP
jgi:iron complex transport system permease protein